ncbi:lactate racemase domain-containing protein [Haloplanus natans]|uniref:lactate racemase domain-containing protein n=1 Tax=Haloplanus natans TaxID=376171 RepID=UPI000677F3A6|nr:lactate racemase domain-containing protein [Haloplanus natans]
MTDSLVVPEDTIRTTVGDLELPRMGVVEQVWETDSIPIDAIESRAADAVGALDFASVPDGGEVAIGAGSRGIANLPAIVRGVVAGVRDRGYDPFVFPAMGSHGGATAEGQREKLNTLGVSEASVGCEIRATMAVETVGETPERGVPVYADENAVAADGIVMVNRIKPHTDFGGEVESGLSKMLVIGMGKQKGAKMAHDWAVDWSLRNMLPEITSQLLDALPVAGGVAVVEDEHDDTTLIEGVPASGFLERERELLEVAYERMPMLPFDEVDVLVVDRIGKDVSGQGMDTNVTGRRHFTINEPEPESPEVKRIYLRGFTAKTKGNAMGMGQADFAHRDVKENLDWPKALINAITASTVRSVRLPPVVENDRAGLLGALGTIGPVAGDEARVLRVTDTMRLERCYASAPLIEAARKRDDLRVVAEPGDIAFDDRGDFVAPSPGED